MVKALPLAWAIALAGAIGLTPRALAAGDAGPTTQPAVTSAAESQPAGQVGGGVNPAAGKAERAMRSARLLVMAVTLGLLGVLIAMIVWVLHWGRQLRQRMPDVKRPKGGPPPDPWVVAGQRMNQPTAPDEQEEP